MLFRSPDMSVISIVSSSLFPHDARESAVPRQIVKARISAITFLNAFIFILLKISVYFYCYRQTRAGLTLVCFVFQTYPCIILYHKCEVFSIQFNLYNYSFLIFIVKKILRVEFRHGFEFFTVCTEKRKQIFKSYYINLFPVFNLSSYVISS